MDPREFGEGKSSPKKRRTNAGPVVNQARAVFSIGGDGGGGGSSSNGVEGLGQGLKSILQFSSTSYSEKRHEPPVEEKPGNFLGGSCALCRKKFLLQDDLYMYNDNYAYCTPGCRAVQIGYDEMKKELAEKEKAKKKQAKAKATVPSDQKGRKQPDGNVHRISSPGN